MDRIQHETTLSAANRLSAAGVPIFHARSRQIKTIYGSGIARITGYYGTLTVSSTEQMHQSDGYCPIFQHHRDGEHVFAFENAAVISDPPTRQKWDIEVEPGEPFAYVSLTLSGVYSFERNRSMRFNDRFRLVRHSGAQAYANGDQIHRSSPPAL